ncbi:DUF4097 family beta strand repeat-containing protein [Adlercreutzia murintestinalis]|uniref:DUF4097 family beta strand repeat-containing protein n=1 Tax=Adlercreutzia murintestinalis TaxID=2941325 RepID=UPI002040A839|nr:DUF4097 family beta strand repeat-containing protein [Adlercreutzia murintestinalis]
MTRLTTASYVKILLVILLCVVLCGGIVGCSRGCSMAAHHANDIFWQTYESYDLPEAGNAEVDAARVKNLEVDWAAGSVVIDTTADEEAASNSIVCAEENGASLPESRRMRWSLEDDTLRVSYGPREGWLYGCSSLARKNLKISIPESVADQLGNVVINGASGSYEIGAIGCDSLSVNLASGQVTAAVARADALNLDVASGNVRLAGPVAQQLNISLASGDVVVDCQETCPESAYISSASGHVEVALPESSLFTVQLQKMSGSFTCDFPQNGGQGIYGMARDAESGASSSTNSSNASAASSAAASGAISADDAAASGSSRGTASESGAPSRFDITMMSGQVTLRPR